MHLNKVIMDILSNSPDNHVVEYILQHIPEDKKSLVQERLDFWIKQASSLQEFSDASLDFTKEIIAACSEVRQSKTL